MVTTTEGVARLNPAKRPTRRSLPRRTQIVDAAMRLFAEKGFSDARMADLAEQLGIAKGSIFQHFHSKDELFFEAYKKAVRALPAYLQAPPEHISKGFFATLQYWLGRTEHLVREDWIPYRISLLGNYGTDLNLRRQINRFLVAEDPYGTMAFVKMGIERGEIRSDIPMEMIVSLLDWTMERFQDALLTEELDPGLFRRSGEPAELKQARITQFLQLLNGAIAAPSAGARASSAA